MDEFYGHGFELIIIDRVDEEETGNDELMKFMWSLIPRQRILLIDFLKLCSGESHNG